MNRTSFPISCNDAMHEYVDRLAGGLVGVEDDVVLKVDVTLTVVK